MRFFLPSLLALGILCHLAIAEQAPIMSGQHPQRLELPDNPMGYIEYLIYLPEGYPDSASDWPLMLFLHGAGQRGRTINHVASHGPPKRIKKEGLNLPCIVVSPQCPRKGFWSKPDQLQALDTLLNHLVKTYRVDEQRQVVTGLSMGGYGSWALAIKYPHRFAAIAPICGSGKPSQAAAIAHLPVWAFHGEEDKVVPFSGSADMVNALKAAGSKVRFTPYPGVGHDAWTVTYENPELYEWLLKHRRK